MDQDSEDLLAYCATIGGNPRERGHLQQGPPLSKDYVFPEVAMNEFANRVCCQLYGNKPKLTFYNGNTNYPGSTTQSVHMDGYHLNKAPDPVHPPHSVVVNVPLQSAHAGNGAIQLWPGSHVIRTEGTNRIDKQLHMERRTQVSPIQMRMEPGDVLIRDVRLWHRGVPNHSTHARHMIALIVTSGDLETKHKLKFEDGCQEALEGHAVDANATYVDEPIEYLLAPTQRIFRARQAAQEQAKTETS